MSIEQVEQLDESPEQNEREYWKEQANFRGIKYVNNIPTEKLKALVQEHIKQSDARRTKGKVVVDKLSEETRIAKDNAQALVRCRVQVVDPQLHSWTAIRVTAGNDNFAPIKRTIPLNGEVWHVERILLNVLKSMKYTSRKQVRHQKLKGIYSEVDGVQYSSFQIVELPPLTPEELEDLKSYQIENGTGRSEDKPRTI